MVYIFMQTFAVPGTLSLSLLSGALYGTLPGLLLVSGECCTVAILSLHAHTCQLMLSDLISQKAR